jgi:hypothetical protein
MLLETFSQAGSELSFRFSSCSLCSRSLNCVISVTGAVIMTESDTVVRKTTVCLCGRRCIYGAFNVTTAAYCFEPGH